VVKGYETERDEERRVAEERQGAADRARRAEAEARNVAQELFQRLTAARVEPDCVIEFPRYGFLRDRGKGPKRYVTGPEAWLVGHVSYPGHEPGNYEPFGRYYALDRNGVLHSNKGGVGRRREFSTLSEKGGADWSFDPGVLLGILRAKLKSME
jgi:hypothetical protein